MPGWWIRGDIVTIRGVSAALDLGLYLVERLAGADACSEIARLMDYPYYLGGAVLQQI